LSRLYLSSNDKLSGLIYGEIFMNLERTTKRTLEISKLMYNTYKKVITIDGDNTKIEFCDIIVDASKMSEKELRLPLCASFGKNFIMSIIGQKEINLKSLSEIRVQFIKNFFKEDYKKYPNVLFEYQKKLLDNGILEAYNHYIFQMGTENEFKEWKNKNGKDYEKFVDWYTNPENYLKIDKNNLFINE
jgi:hypothetical protein